MRFGDRVQTKKTLIVVFVFVCLSVIFSLGSVFCPISQRIDFNDSSIYQYIGYVISEGGAPYLDVFDHKGIYFYFLNALGYVINPKWGMWVLIIVSVFGNLLAVFHLAKKFLDERRAFAVAILIGSAISCTFWDGDTPDFLALVFCVLSFSFLVEYIATGNLQKKNIFLVGCFSSVAFWMKPNMIAGTLVVCACLLVEVLAQKKIKLAAGCFVSFILGFVVVSLPGIVWLQVHGALGAMVEDYFLFNFTYSGFYSTFDAQLNAFSALITNPISMLAVVCILVFLVLQLKNKQDCSRQERGLLLCGGISYAACLIYASTTGNSYVQYAMLLYPSIVLILIGMLMYVSRIFEHKMKFVNIIAGVCCVVVLGLNAWSEYQYCECFWTAVPQEDEELAYVEDNSEVGDTIAMVSPYNSGFYLATNRDSATKYIYIQLNHFVSMEKNLDAELDFWNEYTDLLIESKPRIIVFDNGYVGDDSAIKSVLERCLSSYHYAGSSAYKDFYVLPASNDEEIPDFVSETEVNTSAMSITITEEMLEQYRNGEITVDDILSLYSE